MATRGREHEMTGKRPLYEIAADIRAHWAKVNYAAEPYLEAMESLDSITGMYFYETAESVVLYFLSNATSWRGEDARRVKAELRGMLKALAQQLAGEASHRHLADLRNIFTTFTLNPSQGIYDHLLTAMDDYKQSR